MFVRDMRCCSVVTVIVDCFMVCLHVVICSSGSVTLACQARVSEQLAVREPCPVDETING